MATMTTDEYREIVKTIINTATGGSASGSYPWDALNKGNYSAQDLYDLMQTRAVKNAGYEAVLNADGTVRTYTYINKNGQIKDLGSYDDIAGAFNSNYQTGTASGGTIQYTQPIDTSLTGTEPAVVKSAGTMTKYADSVKGAGNFVFGSVLPAIGAAATGIALGKIIDKTIYEVGTNVFGADNLEAFDPDTWGSITAGDDSLGAKAFNTIFGINPDTGDTQMYMDENAFAYTAMYLKSIGAFSEPNIELVKPNDEAGYFNFMPNSLKSFTLAASHIKNSWYYYNKSTNNSLSVLLVTNDNYGGVYCCGEHEFITTSDAWPNSNFTNIEKCYEYGKTHSGTIVNVTNTHTYKGKTKYISNGGYLSGYNADTYEYLPSDIINHVNIKANQLDNYKNKIYDYLVSSSINEVSAINGINNQDNAKKPDLSSTQSIEEALNALKEQYPELWNNRVENSVVQPDGTTKTYTYIPVPMPTGGTADRPTTEGAKQSQPEVDPSTATDTLLKTIIQILTQTKPVGMTDVPIDPINPNPPDTGSGDTPPVVIPTGSASALYTVYNPTQQQLSSFGAWLWSADFVDQIKKLFSDPMQSIIGLHKIFCAPHISGESNIKVGYLDSGVASNVVSDQYTTLSCGSVDLAEYFGNVFDYSPYTDISIYLPFVGIVRLNTADVMRSKLTVTYHFDILTGACLAEVKVTRDSYDTVLYQYTGNASTQYPLSSGSYMGILSGVLSIAGGVAGTVATGGAAAPLLIGSAASALSMRTKVERSGSLSGNAGAMGIKIPYLIINRPQAALANNYQNYIGIPANQETLISDTSGFVKYDIIHLTGVTATEKEKSEIQTLFSQGVLI